MNKYLRDILLYCDGMNPENRQIGKTYVAAELARRVGGILFCFSRGEAERVKSQHGVPTASIESFVPHGITSPFIIDQDAAVKTMLQLLDEIDRQKKTAATWQSKYTRLKTVIKEEVLDTGMHPDVNETLRKAIQ